MRQSKLTRFLAALTGGRARRRTAPFPLAEAGAQAPPAPEVPVFGASTGRGGGRRRGARQEGQARPRPHRRRLHGPRGRRAPGRRVPPRRGQRPGGRGSRGRPRLSGAARPRERRPRPLRPRPNARAAPSVIAFVFDRPLPEARKTAEKAALSYTDRGYVEGDLVACSRSTWPCTPFSPSRTT
jgi:hypothetical protein